MLLVYSPLRFHQVRYISRIAHRMPVSMYLLSVMLTTHLAQIDIDLIKFICIPFSSCVVFQILTDFNTLVQQLLPVDFLFHFTLVEGFSVTWSWVVSRLFFSSYLVGLRGMRRRRLLVVFAHDAHFHQVLVLLLLIFSISLMSISWSSSNVTTIMLFKVVISWLGHGRLNVWVFPWLVLHSAVRLKCATARLDLVRIGRLARMCFWMVLI